MERKCSASAGLSAGVLCEGLSWCGYLGRRGISPVSLVLADLLGDRQAVWCGVEQVRRSAPVKVQPEEHSQSFIKPTISARLTNH